MTGRANKVAINTPEIDFLAQIERCHMDLDFNFTIEADSVCSVQINSENEATSPSQSAISPIETPVGDSGKDGIFAPGQNGLAKSNTDPVEKIPSFSESDATSSSRKTILPIETRGSCTSRIAVL
ncbi:hypothetical protein quinque_013117 [Culex quinquefasciatus]